MSGSDLSLEARGVITAIRDVLAVELRDVVEGEALDLLNGAEAIADRATRAALAGRYDVLPEISEQSRPLLEQRRLRIQAAAQRAVQSRVSAALAMVFELARLGLLRV